MVGSLGLSSLTSENLHSVPYSQDSLVTESPKEWDINRCVVVVVKSLSHVPLFVNPWTAARQALLPSSISRSLLKFMSIELLMLSISSSATPFSFCLQSFPESRSFPVSQLFTSGGQSIGASASASVLTMNIQDWFPLGLTDLISLQSKGLSNLQHHSSKASVLWHSALWSNSHICTWLLQKS